MSTSTATAVSPKAPTDPSGGLPRAGLMSLVGWGLALALFAWAWRGADMRPGALWADSANMVSLAREFFPPDFTDWRTYVAEMVVTVQVALWGTLLAVVCAVPFGLLSSSNITPAWVRQPVRRLMDAARAINEMVFAMIFIVAVGLGPFAGVLALWCTPRAFWPNCSRRRSSPSTPGRWKASAPPAPMRWKKSSMA